MADKLVIPEGWEATTLGRLGSYLNGRAFKRSEWSKTGRPIIRIQDLTGSNSNPNHFQGKVEERHVVRSGDFLISWSATLGAYIWDGPEAVLNQHIFKVESRINKRFHYHLVRERIAELQRHAHGSGIVHVTKGVFERTPVAVPEDEQLQQKIADAIDSADARRASATAHLAAAGRAIDRLRQVVLAAACSGRLTQDWRGDGGSTELGELPASWSVGRIGDVGAVKGGKRLPKGHAYAVAPTPHPYIRVADFAEDFNISDETLKYLEPETQTSISQYTISSDDVYISIAGTIGRVGRVPRQLSGANLTENAAKITSIGINPDYIVYWLASPRGVTEIDNRITSSGQPKLALFRIEGLPIPIPPDDEQDEIVRCVDQLLVLVRGLKQRIEAAEDVVERNSHAILAKAFSGNLVFVER